MAVFPCGEYERQCDSLWQRRRGGGNDSGKPQRHVRFLGRYDDESRSTKADAPGRSALYPPGEGICHAKSRGWHHMRCGQSSFVYDPDARKRCAQVNPVVSTHPGITSTTLRASACLSKIEGTENIVAPGVRNVFVPGETLSMAGHNPHSIVDISGDLIGNMPDLPKSRASAAKKRKNPADRDLEGSLVSALLAGDKELDHVLREVESISQALRSGKSAEIDRRIASHPAVWCAVKQMLIERELRYLALSDDLTCLYNRRGFYAAAAHQLKVARRKEKAAVLLFCDVDGLKAINDTFGHREGDFALVRASDALEEVFRDSDVLARLGGDEFAVLATELSPEHHHTILSRLYRSVKKAGKDEVRYELSLSVGAAWFDPQNPATLGELMEQADHAMYEEKRKRRLFPLTDPILPRTSGGGNRSGAFALVKGKN